MFMHRFYNKSSRFGYSGQFIRCLNYLNKGPYILRVVARVGGTGMQEQRNQGCVQEVISTGQRESNSMK